MPHYDAIVLGAGGIGSAALYELARRGVRVLGIDRFAPPHDRGSSHGQTRIIRQAYFEHPDYVPLVLESYRRWHELEQRSGRKLFYQTGLVELGPPTGVVVPGVLRAATEHNLPVVNMTASEVEKRWPGLRVGNDLAAVFEPAAGYLLVEDCIKANLDAAKAAGAVLQTSVHVTHWTADHRGVVVHNLDEDISADRLVIAAGAWAGPMLQELNLNLTVRRKSLFWFKTATEHYDAAEGLPTYLFELPSGVFYGFPEIDSRGIKVAEHSGGQIVNDADRVDRSIRPEDQQALLSFLRQHLPGVKNEVTGHTVCLYTMSPDEHFIIDRHPDNPNVAFAAGLSGHGFKFAPVLGRALAELVLDGATALPIDFLSLRRFSQ
jgi:monomeric sarcosine oxidase